MVTLNESSDVVFVYHRLLCDSCDGTRAEYNMVSRLTSAGELCGSCDGTCASYNTLFESTVVKRLLSSCDGTRVRCRACFSLALNSLY